VKVELLKILKPRGGKIEGAPYRLREFALLLMVKNIIDFLKNGRLVFLICTFFVIYDASAENKWDSKSPYWVAGVCGKLEFLAWDKLNMHPPYHVKYIVKHISDTYTAEKISSNKGASFHAIFPDDFVDSKGEAAYLSASCVSDKVSYEIYGEGIRIERGEINVDHKIYD